MLLSDIATFLGDTVRQPLTSSQQGISVHSLSALALAQTDSLSFIVGKKYLSELARTKAAAVLVSEALAGSVPPGAVAIVVSDPYAAFARVSALFANPSRRAPFAPGIHATASVHPNAAVAKSASIGPNVVIEAGAKIGERCVISAGSFVGENVSIGDDSWIAPRVSLYFDTQIGKRAIIHSGAVIGADGFGFAKSDAGWIKIEQIGCVRIGDDVEIGANTTIDRGALGDTEIGHGCKFDNQIQIGHNVKIGDHTAMAACVGVAGSAVIGSRCMLGGSAGVLGHLSICDDVTISAMSLVASSIDKPGFYSGIYPLLENSQWEKTAVLVKQLPQLRQRLRSLEQAAAVNLSSSFNPANP